MVSNLSAETQAANARGERLADAHRTVASISLVVHRASAIRNSLGSGLARRLTGLALSFLALLHVCLGSVVADPDRTSFNWEQLGRQLRSNDPRAVGGATLSLEEVGVALSEARLHELLGIVGVQAADAGGWILDAAESLGIDEGRLGSALRSSDGAVRRGALMGLTRVWVDSGDVVGTIAEMAQQQSEDSLRFDAIDALADLPVHSRELESVVQTVLTRLGASTDGAIRVSALEALGRRGVATPEAIGELREALQDADARVRISGILGCTCLGPKGRPLSSVVLRLASDADEPPIGRQLAIRCLRTVGVAPADRLGVVRSCFKWLSERRADAGLRQEAIALALDTAESKEDPGLGQSLDLALTDPDSEVVTIAVDSISRHGDIALAMLQSAVDSSGAGPSRGHLRAVGALGAQARALAGAVEHWAFVDGFGGHVEAVCCLIRLDAPSDRLFAELRKLLRSGSLAERFAVITALSDSSGSFGPLFRDLEKVAEDPALDVPEIAFAIRRVAPTEGATRALGKLLMHGELAVRAGAARALAELSVHSRDVRGVLLAASSSSTLAYTAVQGLGELPVLDATERAAVRRCLVARSSPRLRVHAAAVLAAHESITPITEGALRTILSDPESPRSARRLACSTLERRPSLRPATVMRLIAVERCDTDPVVRASARAALARAGIRIGGLLGGR